VHGEGGEEQRPPQGEDQLHQDDHGQEQGPGPSRPAKARFPPEISTPDDSIREAANQVQGSSPVKKKRKYGSIRGVAFMGRMMVKTRV
jgi:hypothetical protein